MNSLAALDVVQRCTWSANERRTRCEGKPLEVEREDLRTAPSCS